MTPILCLVGYTIDPSKIATAFCAPSLCDWWPVTSSLIGLRWFDRKFYEQNRALKMRHVNREPGKYPPINDQIAVDAVNTNAIWFHVVLRNVASDFESLASFYALCPMRPNVGDVIIAEDKSVCIVRTVTFVVTRYANGYQLVPTIIAVVDLGDRFDSENPDADDSAG